MGLVVSFSCFVAGFLDFGGVDFEGVLEVVAGDGEGDGGRFAEVVDLVLPLDTRRVDG